MAMVASRGPVCHTARCWHGTRGSPWHAAWELVKKGDSCPGQWSRVVLYVQDVPVAGFLLINMVAVHYLQGNVKLRRKCPCVLHNVLEYLDSDLRSSDSSMADGTISEELRIMAGAYTAASIPMNDACIYECIHCTRPSQHVKIHVHTCGVAVYPCIAGLTGEQLYLHRYVLRDRGPFLVCILCKVRNMTM